MIDVDQMVAFLSGDPYLITPGETLTPQIQRLIAPYSPSVSMRMFRGGKGEDGRHLEWKVEIECQQCGSLLTVKMTKTKLLEHFQRMRKGQGRLCANCEQIQNEIKQKEAKEREIRDEEIRKENTEEFIRVYLNPYAQCGECNGRMIYDLRRFGINGRTVEAFIKSMKYRDFLNTPYWKTVAAYVKYKAKFKCQICGKSGVLNVHHRNYEHHGMEIYHTEDLVCLCAECHNLYHGK